MIPTSRLIYTQYKRKQAAKETLPIACNAIKGNAQNMMSESRKISPSAIEAEWNSSENVPSYDFTEKQLTTITTSSSLSSTSSSTTDPFRTHDENDKDSVPTQHLMRAHPLKDPIALLPQYLTVQPTTLTITKHGLSNLWSTFSITYSTPTSSTPTPLFEITHSRTSLTVPYLTITDVRTSTPLLSLNRHHQQRPISHAILDPEGTRTAEIQGNFALPLSDSRRATAMFTNACSGEKTRLGVYGGWKGRPAEVKVEGGEEDDDEVLAWIRGHGFGLGRLVHGGREYEVQVAPGVDVVLIVALVAAMDARAD